MRSIELHGERRSRNTHFVTWVVRFRHVFLKVRVFRDVRHQFQNFVAHLFAAQPAERENGIARQDHSGTWLIVVADFIDP